MFNKGFSVQEQLASIKKSIARPPIRYEFSSYVEYICAKGIEDFTDIEIKRASEQFLPVLENMAHSHNTAEALRESCHSQLKLGRTNLNYGATILPFTAIAKQFVEDIRVLPEQHYWAIWFCIEVIHHLAMNNVSGRVSCIRRLDEDKYRFDVPSGEKITYRALPILWKIGGREENLSVVGILRAQNPDPEPL